jgi:hypothetical protein
MRAVKRALRSGVVVIALVSSACPGSLEDPERFIVRVCGGEGQPICTSTTSTEATPPPLDTVFRPRCGFPGCHAPPVQGGLDLSAEEIEDRLVSVTSSSALCAGRVYVVPGEPTMSLLYLKMTGEPCGSKMPLGGSVSPSELSEVREWIEGLEP